MTAYEKWIKAGNTGTLNDYLTKLVGDPGYEEGNERNGASAYELWIAAGNTGTEAEWQASLKGEKGDTGNTLFATFDVDITNGQLQCTTPDAYTGPTFDINEQGNLEVIV